MTGVSSRIGRRLAGICAAAGLTIWGHGALAQDWWSMGDAEFAETYADMAFSDDIEGQSQVAWMLFARVNQPQDYQGLTVATWELWPSNADTFDAPVGSFAVQNKVRLRPLMQATKAERAQGDFDTFPKKAGEERTRNLLSYGYITGHNLVTKAGVAAYLNTGNAVDVPLGSVEIKADWVDSAVDGAYQYTDTTTATTFSLAGLHIMVKMRPTPADPFTSEEPSWFWTTFEFNGNEGLDHARGFITYGDVLAGGGGVALLQEAGLGGTPFVEYSSNGSQIRFTDVQHPGIVMGNTKMEDFAGEPLQPNGQPALPPSQWTAWNTSCHTCHATAAFSLEKGEFQAFVEQIGTGPIPKRMMDGYSSMDFIWSIPFNAK